ncbi:hypothetical protein BRC86_09925 [Halobacteriales archaeon QS_3_64_16]|nr:MAG: hypothetical protein BRC86_09925 [Halobacteriales archaeon QS_3_64_16]
MDAGKWLFRPVGEQTAALGENPGIGWIARVDNGEPPRGREVDGIALGADNGLPSASDRDAPERPELPGSTDDASRGSGGCERRHSRLQHDRRYTNRFGGSSRVNTFFLLAEK